MQKAFLSAINSRESCPNFLEYSSTLNVSKNIKNHSEGVLRKKFRGNPRIISDKDDIEMINNLLKPWIKGLKYDL